MRSMSGEARSIWQQVLSMHKTFYGLRTANLPSGYALDMRFLRNLCVSCPLLISSHLLQLLLQLEICDGRATGNQGGVPDIERIFNAWELMNKGRITDA